MPRQVPFPACCEDFCTELEKRFCNKCFIFYSSIFQALSVPLQTVTLFCCLFAVSMDESKSFTHLQETSFPDSVDRVNSHSLLSAQPLCKVFFFNSARPKPAVSSQTQMTPLQCNIWHFVRLFLVAGSSCGQRPPLLPRQHICRLRKLSWYSRTFIPLFFVFVFHALATRCCERWLDGQLLFMSTGNFVSFLEVSAWPSLDTCTAPGTNVNQSVKVGKVTVELSGNKCNKKGNYWLTFKGTRKKEGQKGTIFWIKSWQDEWGTVWLCLLGDAEAKNRQFRYKTWWV